MRKKERLNYYDKFIECSNYSIECAELLKQIIDDFKKDEIETNIEKMHKIENNADNCKHEMMEFLLRDFLPPIEREDIMNLAHIIDNVTDYIDEILININIFNIEEIREEVNEFCELLITLSRKVKALLEEFKEFEKSKTIQGQIIEINGLEENGDTLYARHMKGLYRGSGNPIEIITWSNIYNGFENCFDECESVADYVESIIMKNS